MGVIRSAFVSGTILNNPLAVGDTAFSSAGLSSLAAVATPDIAKLILDPAGSAGVPEVVYITAHTAAATTATITRGAEGSTARQHSSGIPWVNGPTLLEFGTPVSTTTPTLYNPLNEWWMNRFPPIYSTSNTTLTQNQAYLGAMEPLLADVTITTLVGSIGTQNGNIDAGIYSYDGTTFTRIVSLGSTACPASSSKVAYNITDTILYKGTRYFTAFATDSASATAGQISAGGGIVVGNYFYTKSGLGSTVLPSTISSASAGLIGVILTGTVSGGTVI